jgi:integral membrane sensor domain MASE1
VGGGEWASLIWGFFWRGLAFTIACAFAGALAGGIAGAIIGIVMGMTGFSFPQIASVTRVIGFLLGMAVAVVGLRFYITWLLRSRFGPFRLVLVRRNAERVGAGLGTPFPTG